MKKRRLNRKFRRFTDIALYIALVIVGTILLLALIFWGILQSTYRYSAVTPQEIAGEVSRWKSKPS